MIRLATGFNQMKKHLRTRRLNRIARAMRKTNKPASAPATVGPRAFEKPVKKTSKFLPA